MTASSRTDKLFPALTALERAVLVLRAWKAGGEEDRQVRATIPDWQIDAFNRYIALMNGVNQHLGPYVVVMRAIVEQLGLIDGWLLTMHLWAGQAADLAMFISRRMPVPITVSAYEQLKKRSRRKEPRPDWGLCYEVKPDSAGGEVARQTEELNHIRKDLRRAPFDALLESNSALADETYAALLGRLTRQVSQYWSELRAAECLIEEAAREFGEDPAIPELRATLDWMHQELVELQEKLNGFYRQEAVLSEPTEDTLAWMRKIANWPEAGSPQVSSVSVEDIGSAIRTAALKENS